MGRKNGGEVMEAQRSGSELVDGSSAISESPAISPETAEVLVREHYGFVGRAVHLAGERDDNFKLSNDRDRPVLLKVAHVQESSAITNLATSVMLHLARVAPEIPVQRVLPAIDGQMEVHVSPDDGPTRTARLTSFLEGTMLRQVRPGPELRQKLGRTLGDLNRALRSFDHPGLRHEHLLWDIRRADQIRPLIEQSKMEEPKLARFLERFQAEVEPQLETLRWQPVHNDFSRDNLVVDRDGSRVVGILDFGDLIRGPLANDVAIAAYQLWDPGDPIESAADVVAGFNQVTPLMDDEIELLYDLILMRIVWRIIISEWRGKRFPENRDYILRNTTRAWTELHRWLATPRQEMTSRMYSVCGN